MGLTIPGFRTGTGRLRTCSPGGFGQHGARLLASGGVDVEIAEEYLGGTGAQGPVLRCILTVNIHCYCGGLFHHLDVGSLAVGDQQIVSIPDYVARWGLTSPATRFTPGASFL